MGCWLQEAEASQQKFVKQRREFEELQAAHRALVRVEGRKGVKEPGHGRRKLQELQAAQCAW